MATPNVWLSPFQVDTGTADTGFQSDPKIVALANGGWVVAWVESSSGLIGTTAGTDIIAKIYDAEGNVVRDSYRLNTSFFGDDERDFDMTATHDGFAISYVDDSIGLPDATGIRYERYDLDGDQLYFRNLGDENNAGDNLSDPQLAANYIPTNDDVYVAYNDFVGGDSDISARVIDQVDALGAEFAGAQNSSDLDRLGDVATLSNGNFVTVYEETDGTTVGIEFIIKNAAGATVAFATNVTTGTTSTEPDVVGLEGGGFVITYNQAGDVLASIYPTNLGGSPTTITVASGVRSQNEPVVTALRDGDFLVVWDEDDFGANIGRVLARRFNPDGTADGFTFVLATGTPALTTPEVTTLADGRLAFAWADVGGDIFSAIYDPRPTTIDPDDYQTNTANFLGTDVITTDVTGSNVLAGAGGDTILGQGGNDTIASSGNGQFFGGGGNDSIRAGLGSSETLDGGTGNDTLDTTTFTGNYSVNLDTGTTNFSVFGESFVNFENLISGSGNDTLTGTSGANLIDGGLGNDSIIGAGGNDTLLGGGGNDTIEASSGAGETVDGGAGEDLIIILGGGSGNEVTGGLGNDTVDFSGIDIAGSPLIYSFDMKAGGGVRLSGGFFDDFIDEIENLITYDNGIVNVLGNTLDNQITTSTRDDTVDGGLGDDTISTGAGDDVIFNADVSGNNLVLAGDGNDTITSSGEDTVSGGAGNDLIFAGLGTLENLDGGAGIDTIDGTLFSGSYAINLLLSTTNFSVFGETIANFENATSGVGNDTLTGSNIANVLISNEGNDLLVGFDGNDTMNGGDGMDTLRGGDDDDLMFGGLGNDTVFGQLGDDDLLGGAGADLVNGGAGNDTVDGGDGDDLVRGEDGADLLLGGAGNDSMAAGNDNDTVEGGDGNDVMFGSGGNDLLLGQNGDDEVSGDVGNDTLEGGAGQDTLRGDGGNDELVGGGDNDTLFGGASEDALFGGSGDDLLDGGTQNDLLDGGSGNDILRGADGFDFLFGGNGDDTLVGGNGEDTLVGGAGQDVLRGQGSNDIFEFAQASHSAFGAADFIDGMTGVGVGGGDIIDLSIIDANETVFFNQAFNFIGQSNLATALLSGAGTLWTENSGSNTFIYGITNNDFAIDLAILVNDGAAIDANDYIASDFLL